MASNAPQAKPLEILLAEISDTLDPAYDPEKYLRSFLQGLHDSQIVASDWELVVRRLKPEAAYQGRDVQQGAAELLAALSESEKTQLREHYFEKLRAIGQGYPNLKREFPKQFT